MAFFVEGSAAVFEAPAVVAGLDDVAMVGNAIEQRGGHLRVTKDGWPLAKGEVRRDDDRGALVEGIAWKVRQTTLSENISRTA